jgi:hypothetical protein
MEAAPNELYSAPINTSVVSTSVQNQAMEAPSQLVPSLSSPNEDTLNGATNTIRPRTPSASDLTLQAAPSSVNTEPRRVQASWTRSAMASSPIAHPHIQTHRNAIVLEMIRRAYEEPRSHRGNPFMSDRNGNRISNLEALTRMARMYYGEGGPFHHQQVALREAESDPYLREQMYQNSVIASYQRMVQANFAPRAASVSEGSIPAHLGADLRRTGSTSILQTREVAILHNQQEDNPSPPALSGPGPS